MKDKLFYIVQAARPNQWIKNLVIYTSIIFSGKLFEPTLFWQSTLGFIIFSLLSSTAYIFNDIIDYPSDRKHPSKQYRPIASGKLSIQDATFVMFISSFVAVLISLFVSVQFFAIACAFLALHFLYSLFLKHRAIFDILAISFSFMMRTFAGAIITGYHVQIWLLLTIFFISIFLATVKRHAELVTRGTVARKTLSFYNEHFLYFLTTTSATLTITAYSLYTFLENPPLIGSPLFRQFSQIFPGFEARKWFMITIPIVLYGIARYAQLLYQRDQGERPEVIITHDRPLITAVALWGIIVITLIYIL